MAAPYSMLGYREADGPRPFFEAGVDTGAAKAAATAADLERYLLIPHAAPHGHIAYIRRAPGEYERMPTRLFVFRHLLTPGNDRIPTGEEVRTGRWADAGGGTE